MQYFRERNVLYSARSLSRLCVCNFICDRKHDPKTSIHTYQNGTKIGTSENDKLSQPRPFHHFVVRHGLSEGYRREKKTVAHETAAKIRRKNPRLVQYLSDGRCSMLTADHGLIETIVRNPIQSKRGVPSDCNSFDCR